MVQWLGFYPSKVEVGVRFTVVATHSVLNFFPTLYTDSADYGCIYTTYMHVNSSQSALDPVCD